MGWQPFQSCGKKQTTETVSPNKKIQNFSAGAHDTGRNPVSVLVGKDDVSIHSLSFSDDQIGAIHPSHLYHFYHLVHPEMRPADTDLETGDGDIDNASSESAVAWVAFPSLFPGQIVHARAQAAAHFLG